MTCKAINNFEIMRDTAHVPPQGTISFHDDDAPAWLKDSQLHRVRVDLQRGLLVVEGVGPQGLFALPFGPMALPLAQSLEVIHEWLFVALGEQKPAYALELKA